MDYARFVQVRRAIWEAFERRLEAPRRLTYGELEELALSYRQVLHDHALAASRYPGTAAARRLQVLALEGTRRLTRQGDRRQGLVHFLTRAFPLAFRRQLGLLGITSALFAVAALAGLVLTSLQPGLGVSMLGPDSIAGLEEGRLWTEILTSTIPPAVSSSLIATNNLSVALVAWGGGVLAGLMPLYIVLLNGFMLGAVVSITMRYSMAGDLLAFVAAHGPLEITLILVAAAAGLGIGRALVAAGDRPRSVALQEAGRDALVVLLGCLPWFVVLGLIEALVSPSPELPVAVKVATGLGLELIFWSLALNPTSRRGAAAPWSSHD